MIKWRVSVSSNGQMAGCMKGNGKMGRRMVKASSSGLMVKSMRENLRIMSVTEQEYSTIKMARNLKAFGRMARSMERLAISGQMELDTMSTILMGKSKGKACLRTLRSALLSSRRLTDRFRNVAKVLESCRTRRAATSDVLKIILHS